MIIIEVKNERQKNYKAKGNLKNSMTNFLRVFTEYNGSIQFSFNSSYISSINVTVFIPFYYSRFRGIEPLSAQMKDYLIFIYTDAIPCPPIQLPTLSPATHLPIHSPKPTPCPLYMSGVVLSDVGETKVEPRFYPQGVNCLVGRLKYFFSL